MLVSSGRRSICGESFLRMAGAPTLFLARSTHVVFLSFLLPNASERLVTADREISAQAPVPGQIFLPRRKPGGARGRAQRPDRRPGLPWLISRQPLKD